MSYSQTIKSKNGFETIKLHGETVKLTDIKYKNELPIFNSIIYLTKENRPHTAYSLSKESNEATLKKNRKTGDVYLFLGGKNFLLDNPEGVDILTCQGEVLKEKEFNLKYKKANPIYSNDNREEILSFLKERMNKPQLNIINPLNKTRELPKEKIRPKGVGLN